MGEIDKDCGGVIFFYPRENQEPGRISISMTEQELGRVLTVNELVGKLIREREEVK